MDQDRIAEYYDYTISIYRVIWHGETHAVHYGFWEADTRTLKEALLNTNKFLAELANITPTDTVLDAGSGIGGSALWLAKNIGCRVVGITLSPKQAAEATRLAASTGLGSLTEFYVRDYLATGYSDNSFDVVWAIESVCHAERKKDFLKEAFRILKPGGRIVIADGFLLRDAREPEEKVYHDLLDGLVLPNLWKAEDFRTAMKGVGFGVVTYFDKTEAAKKSSRILYRKCLRWYPVVAVAKTLGLIPELLLKNARAGLAQYRIVQSGLAGYGVFYGVKQQPTQSD